MAKTKKSTRARGASTDSNGMVEVLGVHFAGLSVGKTTMRLGVVVPRAALGGGMKALKLADASFCDSRLEATIQTVEPDVENGQATIAGTDPKPVSSVVDVKGYSAGADAFRIGLTFAKSEIDVEKLGPFVQMDGELAFRRVGSIPKAPEQLELAPAGAEEE